MKKLLLASMLVFGVVQSVSAGVIYLKNGDRITGTIKRIWDGDVFIEPSYADEFSVDQIDIAYMEDDPARQRRLQRPDDHIAEGWRWIARDNPVAGVGVALTCAPFRSSQRHDLEPRVVGQQLDEALSYRARRAEDSYGNTRFSNSVALILCH